jgi:hypothetical protein
MALIHHKSPQCVPEELNLFQAPATNASLTDGYWDAVPPVSSVKDNNGPIEFVVRASGDDFMDLSQTLLSISIRIVNGDKTALTQNSRVYPINNTIHSIFSQVEAVMNGTYISTSSPNYPYRAYIEDLFSYSGEAKKTQLGAGLFFKDTAGHMEESPVPNHNKGAKRRHDFVGRSNTITMFGRPHLDIFHQNKLMLPGVELKLKFIRSKNQFCLIAADSADGTPVPPNHIVEVQSATLYIRKIKVAKTVGVALLKTLQTSNALYPINRVELRSFHISSASLSANEEILRGRLPKRVIMGLVTTASCNGTYATNPFNFRHANLTSLNLFVGGHQILSKPFTPDYEGQQYCREYMHLFLGTSTVNTNNTFDVRRDDFDKGYCFYIFNLQPDLVPGNYVDLQKEDSMRVEMVFGTALSEPYTCIVLCEYDQVIEVTRNKTLIYDRSQI